MFNVVTVCAREMCQSLDKCTHRFGNVQTFFLVEALTNMSWQKGILLYSFKTP